MEGDSAITSILVGRSRIQVFEAEPKTHPCMKQTRKDGAPALKPDFGEALRGD
jgi:hypothetical protein